MTQVIKLKEIIYDPSARNGTWCRHPYPNHPKGCPNFPKCMSKYPDFRTLSPHKKWYAVIEEFDLDAHAAHMKVAHPGWSARQCKNPIYWQGSVRKRLRENATSFLNSRAGIILQCPEACGIEIFETIGLAGLTLDKTPGLVRKIMLVGLA